MRHLCGAPDTLGYHRNHPEVRFESYVKQQKLALAREVLQKTRIYLDQKYWIYCRQAAEGRPVKRIHGDLFQALRHLGEAGKVVCPGAHPVLEETFKQSDPATRMATAAVIDELSQNLVIEPFPVLTQLEVMHFIRSAAQASGSVHAAGELAWTWPSLVMGLRKPHSEAFDEPTNTAIQKAFFDKASILSFAALVEGLGGQQPPALPYDTEEFQRTRTEETRRHRHEFRTFKEVFLIEVAGYLDALKDELQETMIHLFVTDTGRSPSPGELADARSARLSLADLIYTAFKFDRVGEALPGIRILAGIHAAIRHRDQPHRKGDMQDHMHARIALPYCDIFLTEKNLGNLLTHAPLEYDNLYQCSVLWRDDEIVDALKEL